MLGQAQVNTATNQTSSNLVLGTAEYLPFRPRSFPVIVATFPSNYITDNQTLQQIWRTLEDGGRLIILPAAWITGTGLLDRLAAWIFSVSGESPPINDSSLPGSIPFSFDGLVEAGFNVTHELIELNSSKVLIIQAVKSITR